LFTYIGPETSFITKIFRHTSVNVVYTTRNTIQQHLSAHPPSHSHNKYDRSGVYQLTCPDCSMKYIGQTGRPFSVRFKEHYREYTHDNPKSKFSEHLLQAHHSIGPMHSIIEPLYYITKGPLMNTIERFHIYRETQLDNQLNDRRTVQPNAILDTLARIHTPWRPVLCLQRFQLDSWTALLASSKIHE
jgi:hypothetical protein